MKHTAIFRLMAMTTIWFYCTAFTVQAGQVITQQDKTWAKQALQKEKSLDTVPSSNSIAVLYFNNKTGQEKLTPLEKGLAVMLMTDLAKVDQIQVIERVRLQALLDEMNLGVSGLMEGKTAPRVGKLLGAYYVSGGDILEGKIKDLAVDPSLVDVPFATISKQPTASGSLDELFKLEKEILFDIIDQMKVRLSPEKKAELQKPLSLSSAALLALFIGIDHSDKGEYVEAAKMYEQALVEDPNLTMAQNALQELKGMGLISSSEAVASEQPPEIPPGAESGGSSVGTVVGIGLAVAVAAGAAIAIGGSGSDDDNGTSDNTTPDPTDTTPPTVRSFSPDDETTLNCEGGEIVFTFSEAMAQTGQANVSPNGFATGQAWSGQNYVITWKHDYDFCQGITSVIVDLSGFQDSAGNALSGNTSFIWSADY